MQTETQEYINIITSEYPQVEIHSAKLIPQGLDNVTIDVDDTYIFRFPTVEYQGESFFTEVRALRLLETHDMASVPRILFIGKNHQYIGYKKLAGVTLSDETAAALSQPQRQQLATQLAVFMKNLHASVSITEAQEAKIKEYAFLPFTKIYDALEQTFGTEHLVVRLASRSLREFEQQSVSLNIPRVLHWDLHNGNILVDPKTYDLTGVIDFGSMKIADVHAEFRSIYRFNQELAKETLVIYESLTGLTLNYRRVQLYAWLVRLSDLAQVVRQPSSDTYVRALARLQDWATEEFG